MTAVWNRACVLLILRWFTETRFSFNLSRAPPSSRLPSQTTTSSCPTAQRPQASCPCGRGPRRSLFSTTRWLTHFFCLCVFLRLTRLFTDAGLSLHSHSLTHLQLISLHTSTASIPRWLMKLKYLIIALISISSQRRSCCTLSIHNEVKTDWDYSCLFLLLLIHLLFALDILNYYNKIVCLLN